MIPKIVHQTAPRKGAPENWIEARNRRILGDCTFVFHDDDANRALIARLLPHRLALYDALPSEVIRADIARCLYLHEQGGLYCDTDYYFLRPLPHTFWEAACVLGIEETHNTHMDGGAKIGNAVMASVAGHPLWIAFVEDIFERYGRDGCDNDNIVFLSGPHALSRFLKNRPDLAQDITIYLAPVLYPPFAPLKLCARAQSDTLGVHLCWGSWRVKTPLKAVMNQTRRYLSAAFARIL